jgi:hypothetical protein
VTVFASAKCGCKRGSIALECLNHMADGFIVRFSGDVWRILTGNLAIMLSTADDIIDELLMRL